MAAKKAKAYLAAKAALFFFIMQSPSNGSGPDNPARFLVSARPPGSARDFAA